MALVRIPPIDWTKLDMGRIALAVAGDLAAEMRKRMTAGEITPPLRQATVEARQRKGVVGQAPLLATGLLRDSIKSRKSAAKPAGAQIYIEDRRYGGSSSVFSKGKRRFVLKHESKTARTKAEAAGGGRSVGTLEIAAIHQNGMPLGRGPGVKRKFFFVKDAEFKKAVALRVDQAWKGFLAWQKQKA